VPVPGETLDANLRNVAAETAVPIQQRRFDAGTGGSQRRRKSARATADHQHLGFRHNVDGACRFADLFHVCLPGCDDQDRLC